MVQSRHPRAAVCTAAAVLLAVPAVAGSSSASGPGERGTALPPAAVAPAVPAVDGPADPEAAKAQIEKTWATFFDPDTSFKEKAELLQHGEMLAVLLGLFGADTDAPDTSVEITDITFTSPTEAEVTYDLLVSGVPALEDSKGVAVLDDGVWKVSLKSLCGLIELSGHDAPAPPC
ncbi:hypothetical protein PV721_19900 [Streptomyces sp. MB09-01]|uniref:hypothetical protein n=1 Tax=Streptomyces sp. MB09-01 TaxID=3028666 RepID=UPI0029BAF887|nr:hypothetical protein [Streptomyces sp. MB09-01]MDX3536599.1 hypothetical protein [Streptomyces sp. MB09-01]